MDPKEAQHKALHEVQPEVQQEAQLKYKVKMANSSVKRVEILLLDTKKKIYNVNCREKKLGFKLY